MKLQQKEARVLRIPMQRNDRNYFVEFASFDTRGSTMNCSQVVRPVNSKSTILCSFRIVLTVGDISCKTEEALRRFEPS